MKFESEKNIKDYNSHDFLDLFQYYYHCSYGVDYAPDLPLDVIKIKKAVDAFILYGMSNIDFKKFLKWAINEKAIEKKKRMSVGLLQHVAQEYIKKNSNNKNIYNENVKKEKKEMTNEIKKWIKEEKKRLKDNG